MIADVVIPPTAVLIFGGLILPFLAEKPRQYALLILPLAALYLVWQTPDGPALTASFLGYDLVLVRGDALSRLFATIFVIMAFAGGLFALNQNRVVELAAA
ncbi:MAG: hypothetical protein WB820_18565, partial [Rhodoplanes sp.]